MVYFVIGPNKLNGSLQDTHSKVSGTVGNNGDVTALSVEQKKFKMGNLDNMMQCYEVLGKTESLVEGVIKKLLKAYQDVEPKADINKLTVEAKSLGNVDVHKFLTKFAWDESKYPRNQVLDDLVKIMNQRINTVDNNLRHKVAAFHHSREKATIASKKETSSALTRDLNDMFATNKKIKGSDFITSKSLMTMIAVVPNEKSVAWEAEYESINDYIVPRSIKQFEVSGDIGSYRLYRIVLFRTVVDEVIQKAKETYGAVLREYSYDVEEIRSREQSKKDAENQSESDQEALKKTCIESFKDIYSTYAHIKVLKVAVDGQMRFGSPDDYCVLLIDVKKGKDKKIHDTLIAVFAELAKRDLYGTKEAIGETEDFFPYAYALIDQPSF